MLVCKECGSNEFNMCVEGSVEFNLRLEEGEVLMDNTDFQYFFAEAATTTFFCSNCGHEFEGAKKLYEGELEYDEVSEHLSDQEDS